MASLDDGEEEREGNRPKFCTLMKSEPTSLKNLSLQSTQENGYIYIYRILRGSRTSYRQQKESSRVVRLYLPFNAPYARTQVLCNAWTGG